MFFPRGGDILFSIFLSSHTIILSYKQTLEEDSVLTRILKKNNHGLIPIMSKYFDFNISNPFF